MVTVNKHQLEMHEGQYKAEIERLKCVACELAQGAVLTAFRFAGNSWQASAKKRSAASEHSNTVCSKRSSAQMVCRSFWRPVPAPAAA